MGKKKNKGGGAQTDESPVAAVAPVAVASAARDGSDGGNGVAEKQKKDVPPASDGTLTVVLKVDMHCDGCAKKVIKSVRGFDGVEAVRAEAETGKLTVVGKVNPWRVRERVEAKTHKKVDLVSPTSFPSADKSAKVSDDTKKPKEKELVVTTVVLKIRLHCDGCIRRIRKAIFKIKGVENVTVDEQKDLVTVKGTMDAKSLPEEVKRKVNRAAEVVQPKKEDGGGQKKEKAGGDNKKGGGGDGGGEEVKQAQPPKTQVPASAENSKMGCNSQDGYPMEMVHAPQLFSDENPNACSVM